MPELPEVETIRRGLAKTIIGRKIISVEINDTMVVRKPHPKEFSRRLKGQKIASVQRRGKAVIISLCGGDFLVVQLMMTGQLIGGAKARDAKVIFTLSNRTYLNYNDQRRLGRLSLISDLGKSKFLQSLGPEPLSRDFDCAWIKSQFKARKTPVKSLLMDQAFAAGIGNIYVSEILFRAKINPQRPARALNSEEICRLQRITVSVLKEAIRLRGSSVNTYRDARGRRGHFVNRIKVYRRKNEPCPVCRMPIKRIVQSGRSTFFCGKCQT